MWGPSSCHFSVPNTEPDQRFKDPWIFLSVGYLLLASVTLFGIATNPPVDSSIDRTNLVLILLISANFAVYKIWKTFDTPREENDNNPEEIENSSMQAITMTSDNATIKSVELVSTQMSKKTNALIASGYLVLCAITITWLCIFPAEQITTGRREFSPIPLLLGGFFAFRTIWQYFITPNQN